MSDTEACATVESAERRLRDSPYLVRKRVSCVYERGILTLQGRLPSYYLKQIASAAVAGMDGVERVENEIEVVTPARRAT